MRKIFLFVMALVALMVSMPVKAYEQQTNYERTDISH